MNSDDTQRRFFEGSMFRAIREDESSLPDEEMEEEGSDSGFVGLLLIAFLVLSVSALAVVVSSLM